MAPEQNFQNPPPHIPHQQQASGMDTPLQGVYISANTIYSSVLGVSGKLDVVIYQLSGLNTRIDDHEVRLRNLESTRWPLPTLSVLIALAALVVALIGKFG